MEPPKPVEDRSDPNDSGLRRPLSGREILGALAGALALVAALALGAFGYRWVAYLAVAIAVVVAFRSVKKMPAGKKARLAEVVEAHEKSPLARINRLLQWIVLAALLYAALQWLAART